MLAHVMAHSMTHSILCLITIPPVNFCNLLKSSDMGTRTSMSTANHLAHLGSTSNLNPALLLATFSFNALPGWRWADSICKASCRMLPKQEYTRPKASVHVFNLCPIAAQGHRMPTKVGIHCGPFLLSSLKSEAATPHMWASCVCPCVLRVANCQKCLRGILAVAVEPTTVEMFTTTTEIE